MRYWLLAAVSTLSAFAVAAIAGSALAWLAGVLLARRVDRTPSLRRAQVLFGIRVLPIALAGQPELATRLNEVPLRQLKQRVCLRCDLAPLDIRETAAYISTRIKVAGGDPAQNFTREAVMAVFNY